jgi:hypothetical protein
MKVITVAFLLLFACCLEISNPRPQKIAELEESNLKKERDRGAINITKVLENTSIDHTLACDKVECGLVIGGCVVACADPLEPACAVCLGPLYDACKDCF